MTDNVKPNKKPCRAIPALTFASAKKTDFDRISPTSVLSRVGDLPAEIEQLRRKSDEPQSDCRPLASFDQRLTFNVTPLLKAYIKAARKGPKGTVEDVAHELHDMLIGALHQAKGAR